MKITDEIRGYLSERYSTINHYVDPQTDIKLEGHNIFIRSEMPNSTIVGTFYVGTIPDIQRQIDRDN